MSSFSFVVIFVVLDIFVSLIVFLDVSGYFLLNISCLLAHHELNCSWNTANIPNGVQYTISAV